MEAKSRTTTALVYFPRLTVHRSTIAQLHGAWVLLIQPDVLLFGNSKPTRTARYVRCSTGVHPAYLVAPQVQLHAQVPHKPTHPVIRLDADALIFAATATANAGGGNNISCLLSFPQDGHGGGTHPPGHGGHLCEPTVEAENKQNRVVLPVN